MLIHGWVIVWGGGGGIAAYEVDGFSIKSLDSTFSDERRPNFTRKCKECNMQYILSLGSYFGVRGE